MSSQRRSIPLRLQALEARDNPATFGEIWYDPMHVTLSFAPDGTAALGTTTTLSAFLNNLGSSATFQVLKAFQTWAAQTNLNVGLVSDSGAAFDESGALQGDPRFGDIRLGAVPLADDVVALSTLCGNGTSSAGDIFFNTDKTYSLNGAGVNTYDLFTVLLQEAGHAFGLPNSSNTSSVMYEDYSRAVAGLDSSDVTAIQGLYGGARRQDVYEGAYGNNTQWSATAITGPIVADLTTPSGVDWYKFTNTTGDGTWVRLKAAGLSLLTARLEVYNAWGTLLASASTSDPLNNDLSVYVPASSPGATVYVKVSAARSDVFGIGAYRLSADALGGSAASSPNALVDGEVGANDSLGSAAALAPAAAAATYYAESSLASAADADFYRVVAPATAGTPYMTVAVSGVGAVNLAPAVEVYSADGLRLSATVLSTSGNNLVLSVSGLTPGAGYFVRVASATGAVANYDVAVAFRTAPPEGHGSYGTLSQSVQTTAATLNVYQTQVFRVSLADAGPVDSDAQAWVRIYDSDNRLVFQMAVGGGQTSSQTVLLARGEYRLEMSLMGTALPDVPYWFRICGLTDPEGISISDPSATTPTDPLPPPPSPTTTVTLTPPPAPPPGVYWF